MHASASVFAVRRSPSPSNFNARYLTMCVSTHATARASPSSSLSNAPLAPQLEDSIRFHNVSKAQRARRACCAAPNYDAYDERVRGNGRARRFLSRRWPKRRTLTLTRAWKHAFSVTNCTVCLSGWRTALLVHCTWLLILVAIPNHIHYCNQRQGSLC